MLDQLNDMTREMAALMPGINLRFGINQPGGGMRFYQRMGERITGSDPQRGQPSALTRQRIDAFPQSAYEARMDDNGAPIEDTCQVCLETLQVGDDMRTLPCLHRFHCTCIDEWLRRSATCPMCKMNLTS